MNVKTTVTVSVLMFVGTIFISFIIFATEPEAEREAATKRVPMLVQVKLVEKGSYSPVIKAMGTVIPAQSVTLRARVSGEVVSIGEHFKPGALVSKGQLLLQIDDKDYRLSLQQREGELVQARTALDIEMGEQVLAEKEFNRMQRQLSQMQKDLVLRKPQLAGAKANLSVAQAAVAQASLDLQRTRIVAPFNATVLQRFVNAGSNVTENTELVSLASTEKYWVEASVSSDRLAYLAPSSDQQTELNIRIRDRNAWPKNVVKHARLISKLGELAKDSRLAKILIEVPNPLNLDTQSDDVPPGLLLGAFVECLIPSRELENVIRLKRDYIRKNNTVWVMQDNTLSIRNVDIGFFDDHYAYIREGLNDKDAVVISDLSRVREGAELRLQEAANDET